MTGAQWQTGVRGVALVHTDPLQQHLAPQLSCAQVLIQIDTRKENRVTFLDVCKDVKLNRGS